MIIGKTRTNQPVEKEQGFDTAVEGLIQADKDIISQIKVEYDETSDKTTFTFPKGIIPISLYIEGFYNDEDLYFDYANGTLRSGEDGAEAGQVFNVDGKIKFVIEDDYTNHKIPSLLYINSSGDSSTYGFNWYNIFNPSGGTKLYSHSIQNGNFTIITNYSEPLLFGSQYGHKGFYKNDNGSVASIPLGNYPLNAYYMSSGTAYPAFITLEGAAFHLIKLDGTEYDATGVTGDVITEL